jgi:hypothetical protein
VRDAFIIRYSRLNGMHVYITSRKWLNMTHYLGQELSVQQRYVMFQVRRGTAAETCKKVVTNCGNKHSDDRAVIIDELIT